MVAKTELEMLKEQIKTLPEACDWFINQTANKRALSSKLAYARELNRFFGYLVKECKDFAEMDPADLGMDDLARVKTPIISRYVTVLLDKGYAEKTVARRKAAISSFFAYLVENRWLEYNPVNAAAVIKIHESDQVVHLDMDEQIELLDEVEHGYGLSDRQRTFHDKYYKSRDFAIVMLFLDTGIRVSELWGLDVKDVDLLTASFECVRKGGNRQTLYFGDDARRALAEYIEERKVRDKTFTKDEPLFVTRKGERLGIRAIQKLINKYTQAANGKKLSPHKMRSSFAMAYYRENRDILALQREMGHKNLATTNIYAKATNDELKENRNLLGEARRRQKNI